MKKFNGVFVLPLLVIAGCSSDAALTSTGSQVVPVPLAVAPAFLTPPPAPAAVAVTPAPPAPDKDSQPQSGYGFDQWQKGPLGDVFFAFDSSALSDKAQELLAKNAAWFGRNPSKSARVEGHCDSRGTSEYNIALGERRSTGVKEYLVRLGVASTRLETVSFGEERPFDSGKNSEAMANNRRAHFIVK
ncbi:MAG: OmpA family protein [Chlorobium sp.]|nr:MAG: OmpA family protein [Chlorobium sp.]